MNFLCQLSNTLINCCSQLSAVVQMSLITNGPIGPTPPFSHPLPLPPSQLVFPAALALQGTRCQRSRNCVLIMPHCFLDRFQPSGSLISNLYDRWKAKSLVLFLFIWHVCTRLSSIKLLVNQPQKAIQQMCYLHCLANFAR